MRIAVLNHSRRKVGGVEVYLDSLLPAFSRAGHDIAFLYEEDQNDSSLEPISVPAASATWSVKDAGVHECLNHLKRWSPEICFVQGLCDPDLEAMVVGMEGSVLYVHNYYGTCISGNKAMRKGSLQPCERRFGAACLAHYLPDGCGGRNPLTMWSSFRTQSKRLGFMGRYSRLIANSDHMMNELSKHGLRAKRLYLPVAGSTAEQVELPPSSDLRLMFSGRMTSLKGGEYLLAALPEVQSRLHRKLHVTFAGDGPERASWERIAVRLGSRDITVAFLGWLGREELDRELARAHLLVYSSVWPEPFGLSGLEAGQHGVPCVGFKVGGIPEWLHDDINGHLVAIGAHELADGIVRAVEDPKHYARLRSGARERAREFSMESHFAQLTTIFEECRSRRT